MQPEHDPTVSVPESSEVLPVYSPDLEKMLYEAKAAQGVSDQTLQVEQAQVLEVASAGLESSLQERDSIVEQRSAAEGERVKAVDLLAQGTELSAGSEVLAPETEAFLQVAGRTVEERKQELEALNERLVTLDADPAVRNVLYQEAKDEGRRIQLQIDFQKCYWIKTQDGQHRGTIYEVFRSVSPEYESRICGTNIGDSALCQLEGFAFQASGVHRGEKPKGTLDEAEDSIQRMTAIRLEVESGAPDIQKVDGLLSEFLYKRLEHFFATLDQRVEVRAQQLADYYQEHPDDAAKYPNTPTTIEGWKQQLNDSMRNIGSYMESARSVMQGTELKAKRLAQIGDNVFHSASCGCPYGGDQYPFFADDYKETNNVQQAA